MTTLRLALCGALLSALFATAVGAQSETELGSATFESAQYNNSPIVRLVREATKRFRDVEVAIAEGYGPFLGCVSGRDGGAMGIHYINGGLVGDGAVDPTRPEALIYEPQRGGGLRLVGVEFLTFFDAWHTTNESPPVLDGHVFHYSGAPNRYASPAHYELHVWAWQENPDGTFADWNPHVTCELQPAAQ